LLILLCLRICACSALFTQLCFLLSCAHLALLCFDSVGYLALLAALFSLLCLSALV
jgi:hypothetical protein